jgi:hypothetical protein
MSAFAFVCAEARSILREMEEEEEEKEMTSLMLFALLSLTFSTAL